MIRRRGVPAPPWYGPQNSSSNGSSLQRQQQPAAALSAACSLQQPAVFMCVPACLWRRTGEILKVNKEFASLIGLPFDLLQSGKWCIYELMEETSAVNYWEKFCSIAFDPNQKAILSSCTLRNPQTKATSDCCFSFTLRRDRTNIMPICIVGNFLIKLPFS